MGLCFSSCCCPVIVDPLDSYGHPIIGAQVWVYWNAATKGAFADPTLNDTSVGPYTTTGVELKIPVDESNGIYLVKIVATGYATQLIYTFDCGKHCRELFPSPISSPTSVPTAKTIVTNVQTTSCAYQVATGLGAAPNGLPISGTAVLTGGGGPPSFFPPANHAAGGTFPIVPGPTFGACPATVAGTPGVIQIACVDTFNLANHQLVTAHVYLWTCPRPTPAPPTTTPTNYANGVYSFVTPSTLGSAITNIQFSPPKVEGTWDTLYAPAGSLQSGAVITRYDQPGPSLVPLSGSWTIS